MNLRKQTGIELDDLNVAFLIATVDAWNTYGVDAARCFALGA